MKPWLKILLFCIAVSSFVGCDQVTKNLAKTHCFLSQQHFCVEVCREHRCIFKYGKRTF